jgi:hypothetical protein
MSGSDNRFGMEPGGSWTQDEDGNWVRIGDVPAEVREYLEKRGQKVTDKPATDIKPKE